MEINIQSVQGVCSEFIDDKGKKQTVSVVISPLKVTANEEQNRISVVTGCNMWKGCKNEDCFYSLAARMKSKP